MNASVPTLFERFAEVSPGELTTTSINAAELYFGARRSGRPERNLARVETFLAPFELLAFDGKAADAHGRLRHELVSAGMPMGAHDMLIAAIALVNDGIVVTHNTSEFSRVPGLQIEDWTIPK
jgi:tRNA(fMet)-specific endonuclease VapC